MHLCYVACGSGAMGWNEGVSAAPETAARARCGANTVLLGYMSSHESPRRASRLLRERLEASGASRRLLQWPPDGMGSSPRLRSKRGNMTIHISPGVWIDEGALEWRFTRSSGPGGQNVNKVATAAQLRFSVGEAMGLPPKVKARLARLARGRITSEQVLVIEARRFRSREQNRRDAIQRLESLVLSAAKPPKPRKPTRPSRSARRRRLDEKTRRGRVKKLRGPVDGD